VASLEGTWQLVRIVLDGSDQPTEGHAYQLTFGRDVVTFRRDWRDDDRRVPFRLLGPDRFELGRAGRGPCRYRVEGDTLTVYGCVLPFGSIFRARADDPVRSRKPPTLTTVWKRR
jgi:hypothetical protein